jgi:tight adherence protein B
MSLTLVIPMVMAVGAIFLALQAVMSLFTTAQTQRIVNQRLQFKERFENTNEAMIELRKSRGLDELGNFAMPLQWFNQLVVRSGLPYQPAGSRCQVSRVLLRDLPIGNWLAVF